MSPPLHAQILQHPASSAVVAGCSVAWLYMRAHGRGADSVAMSLERCVVQRQWWRAAAAQLLHFDLVHLLLNMTSLWSLAPLAEPARVPGSSAEYLRTSALLLLGCAGLWLCAQHVAVALLRMDARRHASVVGYSGVLFGWMALLAWRPQGAGLRFVVLGGLLELPLRLAPFALLALTQVLVAHTSLMGHLAGIVMGLILATGWLEWVTPYWTACLCTWVALGMLYGLAREGRMRWLVTRPRPSHDGGADADEEIGLIAALQQSAPPAAAAVAGPGAVAAPAAASAAAAAGAAGGAAPAAAAAARLLGDLEAGLPVARGQQGQQGGSRQQQQQR